MLQEYIKLTNVIIPGLILGLMMSCSGGGSNEPTEVIVVAANMSDAGNTTGSSSEGASDNAGQPATDTGVTDGANSDASADGNSTDAGSTTDSGQSTAGETTPETDTSGAVTTGGDTEGTTTQTTTETSTETSTDSGATTDGTDTTAGETAGGTTDAGLDTVGTSTADVGVTAGTTAGTGTDDGGSGTTTSGMSTYPPGSLAAELEENEEVSEAFAVLQAEGLDLSLNDPSVLWTVFLPSNDALAAQPMFDIQQHIHVEDVFSTTALSDFNGDSLFMNNGESVIVNGGGSQLLTIGNATVETGDIVGNTGLTVVHIIDAVIELDTRVQFPVGSLAAALDERGDMTIVLDALQTTDTELVQFADLDDPLNEWTVFLPNDSAFGASTDIDISTYIHSVTVLDSESLTGLSGSPLLTDNGDVFFIEGGGTEPLTFGGAEVVEADVRNEAMQGAIVHIIDSLLE